jgi:DNA topoisomerase-1
MNNDNFYIIEHSKNDKLITKLPNDTQQRIKMLRIPPNWTYVKISKDPSDKVQVIGLDSKNRSQYIYHPIWVQFSKDAKYTKVNTIDFNKFNNIIKKYSSYTENHNLNNTLDKKYVISNMFIIMKDLNIRVGNEKYLEENNSVGLCTLQKSHYKNGKFIFKGKRGVLHEKILQPIHIKFIENILSKSIPGKSLFKYKNEKNENYKKITPEDLNQFLKDYIDTNMTTKDIRTYCANNIFKQEYQKLLNSGLNPNKARIEATKKTAEELGNTPKVCRDSYIDPSLYQ